MKQKKYEAGRGRPFSFPFALFCSRLGLVTWYPPALSLSLCVSAVGPHPSLNLHAQRPSATPARELRHLQTTAIKTPSNGASDDVLSSNTTVWPIWLDEYMLPWPLLAVGHLTFFTLGFLLKSVIKTRHRISISERHTKPAAALAVVPLQPPPVRLSTGLSLLSNPPSQLTT